SARHFLRLFSLDVDDPVENPRIEDRWNEVGAEALDRMRARLAAAEDRRCGGLDREDLEIRPFFLEHLRNRGDVAAGADAGDHRVEWGIGEIAQNLLCGRAPVDLDVCRIVEL